MTALSTISRVMPPPADDDLSIALALRISPEDKARLDGLAGRLPLRASAIARIALRLGLAQLEADPAAALGLGAPAEPAAKKPRKPLPDSPKSERPG